MTGTENSASEGATVSQQTKPPFSVDRLTLHKTNVAPLFSCNKCGMGRTETRWLHEDRGICKRLIICHACGSKAVAKFRLSADNNTWDIMSVESV